MIVSKRIRYFVDESGNFGLFDKKGKPIIDQGEAVILLGVIKIKDEDFDQRFLEFKSNILTDRIFQTIPSIKRTARHFHAKDDHFAIRRETFNFIKSLDISVQVALRRRTTLIEQGIMLYQSYGQKLNQKQLYSDLVTRLFKGKLHKADYYEVCFSHRSNTTENKALTQALEKACQNLYHSHGIETNSEYQVICKQPSQEVGLQIVDYCLWALQRMYNKYEDAYFDLIALQTNSN